MSLHSLNLNLLPVLRELLNRRSITDAGLALGRSPSAISQGLSQLRDMFDDPLLVRGGGGMVLTPRAQQLIEPVEHAYAQMDQLLRVERFDPLQANRQFVIAATDYDAFAHGPAIIAAISPLAPGLRVRFVDAGRDLNERIMSRDIDFALVPEFLLGELASERMEFAPVADSITVAMMRAGHPLAKLKRVGREDLAKHPHVGFYPSWESLSRRTAFVVSRQPLRATALVAQIVSVPAFVKGTNRIAVVPQLVADRIGKPLGLVSRPLAYEEKLITSVLAWGYVQTADPAHRWFRDIVIDAIRLESASA